MFLRTVDILSGLTDEQLETLLRGSRLRVYTKGTVIVTEGDAAQALFIVKTGALKAYLSDNDGKEVILSTLGPNDYFGELALIDDAPRSATVASLERSEVLQVPKDAFQQLVLQDPQALQAVTHSLVARIRQLTDNVRTLALVDVFGRIVHLLNALGVTNAEGHLVITPKLTQQDIASRVGSSREMVSRIFKDLIIGKYIVIDQHSIKVCKQLPMKW
jgi:CRP/FNR family transcriptional regulator, cyclic AMP receptor protein